MIEFSLRLKRHLCLIYVARKSVGHIRSGVSVVVAVRLAWSQRLERECPELEDDLP